MTIPVAFYFDVSKFDPTVTGWGRNAKAQNGTAAPRYLDLVKNGNDYELQVTTTRKISFTALTSKITAMAGRSSGIRCIYLNGVKSDITKCTLEQRQDFETCMQKYPEKSESLKKAIDALGSTFREERTRVEQLLSDLNKKIVTQRYCYNPISRFVLSLFHQLPVPMYHSIGWTDFPLLRSSIQLQVRIGHLPQRPRGESRSDITILYQNRQATRLPLTSGIVDRFSFNAVKYDSWQGNHRFFSCEGRKACFIQAFGNFLIESIVAPFFILYEAIKYRSEHNWENKTLAVLDVTAALLLTPLMALALGLKSLAGAIIHPGIVYKAV